MLPTKKGDCMYIGLLIRVASNDYCDYQLIICYVKSQTMPITRFQCLQISS